MDRMFILNCIASRRQTPSTAAERHAILAWLDELRALAAVEPKKKPYPWPHAHGRLEVDDAQAAATVAELVLEAGGPSIGTAIEQLLQVVASCEDIALSTFWERIARPRHRFGRRDSTAETRASIACWWLRDATVRGLPEAAARLLRLLPTLDPTSRATEILLTIRRFVTLDPPLVAPFLDFARSQATDADALEVRYLARHALMIAGKTVPFEAPQGIFRFAVKVGRFTAVIAVRSEDTLEALHDGIQVALGWDRDHLWNFHMSERLRDRRFEWHPDGNESLYVPLFLEEPLFECIEDEEVTPEEVEEEATHDNDEDEAPPDIPALCIGELGLRVGNKITYHFDFGANHLIPVSVAGIEVSAPTRGRKFTSPHVEERKGKPPQQYPY